MRKGISQEGLKLIACITMLIDHIGHGILYPLTRSTSLMLKQESLQDLYLLSRIVGRIAFPIFAFLLVEGIRYSRSRKKYALRLALGAVLAEIPYNLFASNQLFYRNQSVMVTLLLGFLAVIVMEQCKRPGVKILVLLPFAAAAEWLMADYGWLGVALIGLFFLSEEMEGKNLVRFGGMTVLFHCRPSYLLWFGGISVPIQALGVFSLLFIANYDGRKQSRSKTLQWAFYLFYPIHMLLLWLAGSQIVSGTIL